MITLGYIGEELNLKIRQGASFGPFRAEMKNADGTIVNLTGCTVRGQLRKKALDADVVATLVCVITEPLLGKYEFGLPVEATTLLPAGEQLSASESQYVFDIELLTLAGEVVPLYFGKVQNFREVTRL